MKRLLLVFLFSTIAWGQGQDVCPSCTVLGGHLTAGGHVLLGNFGGSILPSGTRLLQQQFSVSTSSNVSLCTTATTCTFPIYPTTAGSLWIVEASWNVSGSTTITNACGGSSGCVGTNDGFTLCPASECHIHTGSVPGDNDIVYSLSGPANTTSITTTLGSAPSSGYAVFFYEFAPPSGTTFSFDTGGAIGDVSCGLSSPCPGPALTLSATDLVMQFNSTPSSANNTLFGCGAPYQQDANLYCIAFDAPSSIPTLQYSNLSADNGFNESAIAFKTSAGIYAVRSPVFTLVQAPLNTAPVCNGSGICTGLSIPSTGTGNLLLLGVITDGAPASVITAITCHPTACSGGGAWVIPAGCQQTQASGSAISCAYVLNSASGTTSIDITIGPTGSGVLIGWDYIEVSRNDGNAFALDAIGASTDATNKTTPTGTTLAGCTGTNDVRFDIFGGITSGYFFNGNTLDFLGFAPGSNYNGTNIGATPWLLNGAGCTAPQMRDNNSEHHVLGAMAFK